MISSKVIANWLEDHNRNLNLKDAETLKLLCSNLNYDNLSIETRSNGENIIIIPINEVLIAHFNLCKPYLKLHENSVLNLIIIQSTEGKLRWSSVISFLPADGNKQLKLLEKTIENVLNQKRVQDEGLFKFLVLNGTLAYQLSFKNGKINSWGSIIMGDQRPKRKRFALNKEKESNDCYLVTTYQGVDFGKPLSEEYLYTLADNDVEIGNGEMEEENDMEFEIGGSIVSYGAVELFSEGNVRYTNNAVNVQIRFFELELEEMELMLAALKSILGRHIKDQSIITIRSFSTTKFSFHFPKWYKSVLEKMTMELMQADLGITSMDSSG